MIISLNSKYNFVLVLADEVDRAVMQKPAISAKKPVLSSAIKKPAVPARSAGGNSGKHVYCAIRPFIYVVICLLAGAMDEQTFVRSFEDVPTMQIYSPKEIAEEMRNILQIISDPNKDWNKRVDAVGEHHLCCEQ